MEADRVENNLEQSMLNKVIASSDADAMRQVSKLLLCFIFLSLRWATLSEQSGNVCSCLSAARQPIWCELLTESTMTSTCSRKKAFGLVSYRQTGKQAGTKSGYVGKKWDWTVPVSRQKPLRKCSQNTLSKDWPRRVLVWCNSHQK